MTWFASIQDGLVGAGNPVSRRSPVGAMLPSKQVSELAEKIAHTVVADIDLDRVLTETTTDSEGREALRVTLVLTPEAVGKMTGDQVVDVLVGIQQALMSAGEDRFPIVEYATEQELMAEADESNAVADDDD